MATEIPTIDDVRAVVRDEIRAALREMQAQAKPLPVPDAAAELGVSERTLRRQIKAGEVPVIRIGRAVRVDMAAVRPPPAKVATIARLALAGRPR